VFFVCPFLIIFFLDAHGVFGAGWKLYLALQVVTFTSMGMTAFYIASILAKALHTTVARFSSLDADPKSGIIIGVYLPAACFIITQVLGASLQFATNNYTYSAIRMLGIALAALWCGTYVMILIFKLKANLAEVASRSTERESQIFADSNPEAITADRMEELQARLTRISLFFSVETLFIAGAGSAAAYKAIVIPKSYSETVDYEMRNYNLWTDFQYYCIIVLLPAYLYYAWIPLCKKRSRSRTRGRSTISHVPGYTAAERRRSLASNSNLQRRNPEGKTSKDRNSGSIESIPESLRV